MLKLPVIISKKMNAFEKTSNKKLYAFSEIQILALHHSFEGLFIYDL